MSTEPYLCCVCEKEDEYQRMPPTFLYVQREYFHPQSEVKERILTYCTKCPRPSDEFKTYNKRYPTIVERILLE